MRSIAPRRSKLRAALPLLLTAACAVPTAHAVLPNGFPEKMAIYYGPPAQVNGANGNTTTASAVFDDYDLVIFPERLEEIGNPYHASTQTIIQNIAATTRVYGYIDLCVHNPTSTLYRCENWSQQQIQERVDAWQAMGVAGIFLDQAGCDYAVTRQRQNDAVNYIHGKGLSAFINVWEQDHAFAPGAITGFPSCNPNNLPTALGPNDYTLLESWALILSDWSENNAEFPNMLIPRANTVTAYRDTYGTKIATVNTVAQGNPAFKQSHFDYVWWTSLLYGFDAMAWGETWIYSADTHQLPFRSRPNPNGGNIGTSTMPITVVHNGDLHTRTTSAGTIHVDTAGHSGAFGSKNIALQPSLKPATLTSGNVIFTPTHATFKLDGNVEAIGNFRLFIDADNNPATGYRHTGITNNGADYLIDGGNLYSFAGASQTTWNWTPLSAVSPTGIGTKKISVTVARSSIGHTGSTTIGVLGAQIDGGGNELDLLPRLASARWEAKPAYYTKSSSTASDIIAADAIYSEAMTGNRLTFKLTSNGAAIDGYRVWIDADGNANTGYSFWGVGAEYLLERGFLHRWIGTTSTQWAFTSLGTVLEGQNTPAHGLGTSQINATINPDQIGYAGQYVGLLFENYNPTSLATIDLLPDNGGMAAMIVNTESQAGPSTTLVSGDAAFGGASIGFQLRSNGGNISGYRLFIDRDNNAATGYTTFATGADYMIENGNLYSFSGGTQGTWSWTWIASITQSGLNTAQVQATVSKTQIGYVANSTMAVVAQNLSGADSLDWFVRSGGTVWRVRP